jgi:hypothetical protein
LTLSQNEQDVTGHLRKYLEEKQKEIIDSVKYAKRIQTSLQTSEKYILKNIERLKPGKENKN